MRPALIILLIAAPILAGETVHLPQQEDASAPTRKSMPESKPQERKTSSDDLKKEVDTLVAALGDDLFATREKAGRDLVALGNAALPHLSRHESHTDPEVRLRIRAVMTEIRGVDRPERSAPGEVARGGDSREESLRRLVEEESKSRRERQRPSTGVRPREWKRMPRMQEFHDLDSFMRALDDWTRGRMVSPNVGSSPVEDLFRQMDELLGGRNPFRGFNDPLNRLNRFVPRVASTAVTSMTYRGDRLTIRERPGHVKFTVRPGSGGSSSYTAGDLDAFRKKHAAVYEKYKPSGIFELGGGVFGFRRGNPGRSAPSRSHRTVPPVKPVTPSGSAFERYLGVVSAPAPLPMVPRSVGARGLLIEKVASKGIGARSGLEVGDVMISFDGRPLKANRDLQEVWKKTKDGTKVNLRVLRAGKAVDLKLMKPRRI